MKSWHALLTAALGFLLVIASPADAEPGRVAAKGAADLAVASVAVSPQRATVGKLVRVRAVVRNRGRAPAERSGLRFYLSRDARWSGADLPIGGVRSVGALVAGKRATVAAALPIPPAAPRAAPLKLIACADVDQRVSEGNERDNCGAGGRLFVTGGSSLEVIDAAVSSGELSREQGLLYKVYAAFADRRLPAPYRGDGTRIDGTAAVELARLRLASLSAKTRAAVSPFLIPPAYRGSFADPASRSRAAPGRAAAETLFACTVRLSDWDSVASPGGSFRVWWRKSVPGDAARAQAFLARLEGEIAPALTAVMGRNPLSDESRFCSGVDGLLDVYVYPVGKNGGNTDAFNEGCGAGPSYIVIDPGAARGALAHEFMHVLQYTFPRKAPCENYSYLNDATASWAEDFVYRRDNTEHVYPQLVQFPDAVFNAGPGYPGWAFVYSATRRVGPQVLPLLYGAAGQKPPLDALDAALPGGLAQRWPLFARDAWNRSLPPALTESFFSPSWDSWKPRPDVRPVAKTLRGKQSEEPLPIELLGLGKQYYDLTFADGKAAEIVFKDPSAQGADPNLRTFAYFKLANGKWDGEDWTGRGERKFCRDRPSGDVREVVLVNTTTTRPRGSNGTSIVVSSDRPKLKLRDRCDEDPLYVGQVSGTLQVDETEGCADHEQFTYSARLGSEQDPFFVVAGGEGGGAEASGENGGGTYTLDPCELAQTPGCSTAFVRGDDPLKGTLDFTVEGSRVRAEMHTFDWKSTTDACGTLTRGPESIGEGFIPLSQVGQETITISLALNLDTPRRSVGRGTLTLKRVN